MSSRRCERQSCGAAVQLHEDGDLRCLNGHPQRELLDGLATAMAELVRGPLRELREEIIEKLDQQGVEFQSLREEVEALRAERLGPMAGGDEWVELPVMAELLKVSADWLRRNAEALGGRQSKKGGRWKFRPPLTMSLFGARETGNRAEATAAPSPRPLPPKVDLLPVKDHAA